MLRLRNGKRFLLNDLRFTRAGLAMNDRLLVEEIDAAGDVSVFRLNASMLCSHTARVVCEELSRHSGDGGPSKLHLDFGDVEYLAPAGLARLLQLHAELRAVGGGLRVCDAQGCVDLDRLGVVLGA